MTLGLCCATAALNAAHGGAQDASSAIYVRTDSDQTTVITPRIRVGGNLSDATRLDVTYSVDVWTSASVDIRTSASKPVTEQRDEINVGLGQEFDNLKLTAGYRFSIEPDYESHGGSLGVSHDFADHATTLALTLNAVFDRVGRVGDANFSRSARTLSGRLIATQIVDTKMLVQAIYELNRSDGYLSSPYRWVGILSNDGSCAGLLAIMFCIPETNPGERMRHALAFRARRALDEHFSVGAGYRFYTDDWRLISHTADGELAWSPSDDMLLTLRYRYYMQGAAFQYRPRFDTLRAGRQYYTRDKELSPFVAHRVGLDLDHAFDLDDAGSKLRTMASVGWTKYLYSNFIPLSQITAYEFTLALAVEL